MDRYVTVSQGEVFYITEALANLEGLEKGPAGNISLVAAFSLAQEMDESEIILVQETEYTGAGKTVQPQLSFARDNGIEIKFGNPQDEVPGESIVLPDCPSMIKVVDLDLNRLRKSLVKNAVKQVDVPLNDVDINYLAEETNTDVRTVLGLIAELEAVKCQ